MLATIVLSEVAPCLSVIYGTFLLLVDYCELLNGQFLRCEAPESVVTLVVQDVVTSAKFCQAQLMSSSVNESTVDVTSEALADAQVP